jgi:hypothetical protein
MAPVPRTANTNDATANDRDPVGEDHIPVGRRLPGAVAWTIKRQGLLIFGSWLEPKTALPAGRPARSRRGAAGDQRVSDRR